MEYGDIINELAGRVLPLNEQQFRVHRMCEELARFSDEEVAYLLEHLYRGALHKRENHLQLMNTLIDFDVFKNHFERRLSNIFEIADEAELYLATEWLAPLPIAVKIPKGLDVHHELRRLTLGERKWHARKADPNLMEKLLVDPDPSVIKNLLNHPKLLEHDVLKLCSKYPNHPEVLSVVFFNKRWSTRYNVKKALLNNPSTPARIVMLVLPWISIPDTKDLLRSKRFSRGFVRMILKEKRQQVSEPEISE